MQVHVMSLQPPATLSHHFPLKRIKDWCGREVNLGEASQCLSKYGLEPGTILIPPDQPEQLEIVGIRQDNDDLYVKSITDLKRNYSYPITKIRSLEDIREQGYQWITYERKQSHQSDIDDSKQVTHQLFKLFKEQKSCDVFFHLGKEQIGGHALILNMYSAFFQNALTDGFQESHSKNFEIKDCDFQDFKTILSYLYSGLITIDGDNILTIAYLAARFDLIELQKHCSQRIIEILKPNQALECLHKVISLDFFLTPIIENYVFKHLKSICQEDVETILKLPKESVLGLVERCPNEYKAELFGLIVIWLTDTLKMQERVPFLVYQLLIFFPEDDSSITQYAKSLTTLIHVPRLNSSFQLTLHSFPHSLLIMVILAEALRQDFQFSEAALKFGEILRFNPEWDFVLIRQADTFRMLSRFEDAKKLFELSLTRRPDCPFILSRYAEILCLLGELELAKKVIEKSLMKGSSDGVASTLYATILRQMGYLPANPIHPN